MTHQITYRRTLVTVTLHDNGEFRSAYVGRESDITDLLTDDQKTEIASMVREELEDEY